MIVIAGSTSSASRSVPRLSRRRTELGKITGILKDTAGKPLVNAIVNIADKARNERLGRGAWSLAVSAAGFPVDRFDRHRST